MIKTLYGTIYTKDREEAYKFRILDKSPNWQAIKGNTLLYQKYVKLFHYDKATKTYWLPPITWDESKTKCGSGVEINVKQILDLREGQKKAVDFCVNSFNEGISSVLIDSGVGTGKSFLALGLINAFKCKTLITVPSEAIGFGLQEKLQQYCDARYLNGEKIRKAFNSGDMPEILISHRQSCINCWNLINGNYDLMINDEQHHLSDGMKMLCNTWKGVFIAGLTGTPYRREMNKEDFLLYFQKIYSTGLESLPVKVLTYKYFHKYSIDDYMKACEGLEPESPEVLRRLVNSNEDRLQEIKKVVGKLYHTYGFRRLILFVDRREYQDKIKSEIFPNAYVINGDTNKEQIINELKNKDEFLILGMVSACGEGFDITSIQCGILFYSTSREGSLEQAIGRSRRFHGDKKYGYRVDFQETAKIENTYKNFGVNERMKYYKERGFEIQQL